MSVSDPIFITLLFCLSHNYYYFHFHFLTFFMLVKFTKMESRIRLLENQLKKWKDIASSLEDADSYITGR